jgi:hypothetical protein
MNWITASTYQTYPNSRLSFCSVTVKAFTSPVSWNVFSDPAKCSSTTHPPRTPLPLHADPSSITSSTPASPTTILTSEPRLPTRGTRARKDPAHGCKVVQGLALEYRAKTAIFRTHFSWCTRGCTWCSGRIPRKRMGGG